MNGPARIRTGVSPIMSRGLWTAELPARRMRRVPGDDSRGSSPSQPYTLARLRHPKTTVLDLLDNRRVVQRGVGVIEMDEPD